jgi:uncharacterized protein (DUF427 family)
MIFWFYRSHAPAQRRIRDAGAWEPENQELTTRMLYKQGEDQTL